MRSFRLDADSVTELLDSWPAFIIAPLLFLSVCLLGDHSILWGTGLCYVPDRRHLRRPYASGRHRTPVPRAVPRCPMALAPHGRADERRRWCGNDAGVPGQTQHSVRPVLARDVVLLDSALRPHQPEESKSRSMTLGKRRLRSTRTGHSHPEKTRVPFPRVPEKTRVPFSRSRPLFRRSTFDHISHVNPSPAADVLWFSSAVLCPVCGTRLASREFTRVRAAHQ